MRLAAGQLEFEKAMSLRDKLQAIQWLDDRLSLLRRARDKSSFVYPLAGCDGRTRWYLIHSGEVRAAAFPPAGEGGASVAELLAQTFNAEAAPAILSDVAVDSVLLVAGWFRKNADERPKLLTRAQAEEACQLTSCPGS
jgi:excinuclease UvrABC nuclease subunit